MRKHILTSLLLVPFLMTYSDAGQKLLVDSSEHPMIFSSDDSSGSSYLGVDIADVSGERVSALKLKEEKGVEITMVDQDAPAGKAGLKEHDVILTMNGTSVESAAQLRRMIHETPPGRVVTFGLSRDGQPVTVKVPLGEKNKEYAFTGPKAKEYHFEMPEIPPMPEMDIPSFNMVVVTSSPRSGLTVENITPQLGEFFGVKNGNGVLVRKVEKGSRAEKAGFRAGDVIVKINDQPVHDTSDFTHAVRSRNGSSVRVGVVRDKKEQTISLPMPDKKESGGLLDEASLDIATSDADDTIDLGEVHPEVALLQPQMELVRQSVDEATTEIRKSRCELAREARHQAEELRKEALREAEQQRKEAHRQAEEARREAEQQRREAQQQAEEARREAREAAEESQRAVREQLEQQRENLRREQEQLRDQMHEMQRELRHAWLDI